MTERKEDNLDAKQREGNCKSKLLGGEGGVSVRTLDRSSDLNGEGRGATGWCTENVEFSSECFPFLSEIRNKVLAGRCSWCFEGRGTGGKVRLREGG